MSEGDRSRGAAIAAFLCTAGVAAALVAVNFVEDWDGASFALACEGVDLQRFRPHPPGYPLYTAAARALGSLGLDAARCAPWLARSSAIAFALFAAALATVSRGSIVFRALVGSLVALSIPGALRVATMVSPMSFALGAWALAIAVGARSSRAVVAPTLCFAAALASRPTDLVPLVGCTIALASPRMLVARPLVAGSILAALAHAYLIVSVGFQEYLALLDRHRATHASIVGASRGAALHARALGGFFAARDDSLGVALAALALGVALATTRTLPKRARARALVGAAIVVSWVLFAQPAGVERHWLWCGALCAFALARAIALVRDRALRGAAICVVALCASCALIDERARHASPPAAVQLARFVRSSGGVLFAARAGRAAEVEGVLVYEARHFGELRAIAERLPRWPSRVWMTDELHSTRVFPDREWRRFCGARSTRREAVCVRVRMVNLLEDTRDFAR